MEERIITITINEIEKAASCRIDGEEIKDISELWVHYDNNGTLEVTVTQSDVEDEIWIEVEK